MSFRSQPDLPERATPPAGGTALGAARGTRRRRAAVRRLDVLLGVVVAIVWLLIAPGVALAGIIAVLVLLFAGVSVLVGRRRARRRGATRVSRRRRRRRAAV